MDVWKQCMHCFGKMAILVWYRKTTEYSFAVCVSVLLRASWWCQADRLVNRVHPYTGIGNAEMQFMYTASLFQA